MKKVKIILISIVAVFTAMVCSAFVAPAFSENNVTVQSVDGTSIGISVTPAQIKSLYGLMPAQYQDMLKESYGRFRTQATNSNSFTVDGINVTRQVSENGECCTLSGTFDSFGKHSLIVNVGSIDTFITMMDSILE